MIKGGGGGAFARKGVHCRKSDRDSSRIQQIYADLYLASTQLKYPFNSYCQEKLEDMRGRPKMRMLKESYP